MTSRYWNLARETYNGCSETSRDTTSERDARLAQLAQVFPLLLAHLPVHKLVRAFVDDELSYGVGNLFRQDRNEASVQFGDSSFRSQTSEPRHHVGRISSVRHHSDPRSLQRCEQNVGKEFSDGSSAEVDCCSVRDRSVRSTAVIDSFLLPVLVACEFGSSLHEIPNCRGAESSGLCARGRNQDQAVSSCMRTIAVYEGATDQSLHTLLGDDVPSSS